MGALTDIKTSEISTRTLSTLGFTSDSICSGGVDPLGSGLGISRMYPENDRLPCVVKLAV